MAAPTTPLRLQVIDRFVKVLESIVEGTTYNYTPKGGVFKRVLNGNECTGFPTYMVFLDGASGPPEQHLDSEYVETMNLSVYGWVDQELGEPQSKLLKCIRDVEKAIADDAKSTAAGSLGVLCANGLVDLGAVETDKGENSLVGFAWFHQAVKVQLIGDWGDL